MGTIPALAKTLRRKMTEPERRLWYFLRGRRLAKFKFRRQVPIGPFIVDFICMEAKLIVELDGSQHAKRREADQQRTEMLEKLGYRVIRFSNPDLLQSREAVLGTILGVLSES